MRGKQLFDLETRRNAPRGRENFITVDTEHMAADANQELTGQGSLLSRGTHRFESISLPPELARKILLLEISTLLPSPADPALQKELAGIETSLEGDYEGHVVPRRPQGKCLTLRRSAVDGHQPRSRRAENSLAGWQAVGAPMRDRSPHGRPTNQGARELGFKTPDRFGSCNTICRQRNSKQKSIACGSSLQPFYTSLQRLRPRAPR